MYGKLCFSDYVDLTFHRQWHNAGTMQAPCSGKYDCLVGHPSLANGTGASVKVAKENCYNCSSKLCLSFGPFEPRAKAAVQELYVWDS